MYLLVYQIHKVKVDNDYKNPKELLHNKPTFFNVLLKYNIAHSS